MNCLAAMAVSPVKLPQLNRGRARHPQRFAFGHHLAHQSDLLGLSGVKAAAGEQQIPHHGIA